MSPPIAIEGLVLRDWFAMPGASDADIQSLVHQVPFDLPPQYLALLRASNGGEGPLSVSPLRLCLFDVAFAISQWSYPFYREQFSGYFFFGTSGGGDSLALEICEGKTGPVVELDCIAGEESKQLVAPDFPSFLEFVGREKQA